MEDFYYVIYHNTTGQELIVTRFRFIARLVNHFVGDHVIEIYPRSYYARGLRHSLIRGLRFLLTHLEK